MRINDPELVFPVVDRDIEQCAIIEIIAVIEVRGIVRKLTGPKAGMRHRCDQAAIRAKKPAQSEPSGGRLKTAVQKSVRSQPEGRNETVIKPTPIGEASFGKQVRPKAIAKAKAAAKAARKARATVA